MMTMSEQDYYTLYWPKLESAIHLIVQQNPGEFIQISYEEMYSAVYKCVCQQHSGKLYDNLMHLINNILANIKQDLEHESVETYLTRFAHIMLQYFQSVEGIAAIFNYMNRFYVKPKRSTDLKCELLTMFANNIADNPKLFDILSQSSTQPFSTDPQILMSITKGLYSLRPGFAEKAPNLFARFIPNLPIHCTSLDQEIMETKNLQMTLSNSEEFFRSAPQNLITQIKEDWSARPVWSYGTMVAIVCIACSSENHKHRKTSTLQKLLDLKMDLKKL